MELFCTSFIFVGVFLGWCNGGSLQLVKAQVANAHQAPALTAVLPKECGDNFSDRIIGGVEANLGQYPWIARIGYVLEKCTDADKYLCAGNLITERYIVTAAHCITDVAEIPCQSKPGTLGLMKLNSILLGENDEETDIDCSDDYCAPPPQYFKIERAAYHKQYNNPNKRNDIAVMKMNRAATMNGFVFPICLPMDLKAAQMGSWAEIAGWGITNITTMKLSTTLQYLRVPILANEQCERVFEDSGIKIDDSQICSGGLANQDSCIGDSGGPLMMVSNHQGTPKQYLSGIVSFGKSKCGSEGSPAVYTNVNKFIPWILHQIQS